MMDATTWNYPYTDDVLVPRLIFPYDTAELPLRAEDELHSKQTSRMPSPAQIPHSHRLDTDAIVVAVCCAAWMVACMAYVLYAYQMEIFHHLVPDSKKEAPAVEWKVGTGKPRADGVVIKISTFPRCRDECARLDACVGLAYNTRSFTCNLYSDTGNMVDEAVEGWTMYTKPASDTSVDTSVDSV